MPSDRLGWLKVAARFAGLAGVLVAAIGSATVAPAVASTFALAGMPNVSQSLTAYAGTSPSARRRFREAHTRQMSWHDGEIRALPVPERSVRVDADAGPDARPARPAVVFSRCRRDPPPKPVDWTAARGCRIYELACSAVRRARLPVDRQRPVRGLRRGDGPRRPPTRSRRSEHALAASDGLRHWVTDSNPAANRRKGVTALRSRVPPRSARCRRLPVRARRT